MDLAQALARITELESALAEAREDIALIYEPSGLIKHLQRTPPPIPLNARATPYQSWILHILARRAPAWVATEALLGALAEMAEGRGRPIPSDKVLNVHLAHIRRKLLSGYRIENDWGVAYRLLTPAH